MSNMKTRKKTFGMWHIFPHIYDDDDDDENKLIRKMNATFGISKWASYDVNDSFSRIFEFYYGPRGLNFWNYFV